MYTNKEIYLALKLIQDICKQNIDCRTCLFRKESCMINDRKDPANWELVPPPEPVEWRPFE